MVVSLQIREEVEVKAHKAEYVCSLSYNICYNARNDLVPLHCVCFCVLFILMGTFMGNNGRQKVGKIFTCITLQTNMKCLQRHSRVSVKGLSQHLPPENRWQEKPGIKSGAFYMQSRCCTTKLYLADCVEKS